VFHLMTSSTGLVLTHLDNPDPVGNIEGVEVLTQTNITLLQSPWRDESVHLITLNLVQILHRLLDLAFVGLDINNENESVAVFDKLHRGFCGERVFNDTVTQLVLALNAFSSIFGLALKSQGFGSVEVDLGMDPCPFLGLSALCELLGNRRCFC
jgi:hypothetical protein